MRNRHDWLGRRIGAATALALACVAVHPAPGHTQEGTIKICVIDDAPGISRYR